MVFEGSDLCDADVVKVRKIAGLGAGLALHFPGHDLYEQRTVQGETESEPVGSRTDTVARGNVGVLVG